MAHDVFISYSHQDKPAADAVCQFLERARIRCWIAPRDVRAGNDYAESLIEAIAAAKVMVLIFSSNANSSNHVKRELDLALNRELIVVPLRIEDVKATGGFAYRLGTPHWLDAFPPPLEQHLHQLVAKLAEKISALLPEGAASNLPPVITASTGAADVTTKPFKWKAKSTKIVLAASAVTVLLALFYMSATYWLRPAPSQQASVAASQPEDPKEVKLDFNKIDTLSAGPPYWVAAEPFLHAAPISMAVTAHVPDDSVIVFENNLGLYRGHAVAPTISQNFLTQVNIGHGAASFTITFSEPVARVSFMVPKVYPDTASGVTFPAWTATALSASGQTLSSRSEQLVRRMPGSDFPAETYTLDAPGFDDIAAVRFDSDFRLNGVPFAGFPTILIEQITLERR